LVICFKSKAFLPQGSHTPEWGFHNPLPCVFLFWCFCSSSIRSGSIVFSYSSRFAAMYWYSCCLFLFSLKSPRPFFGCNRSESQDSLAVILTALPPPHFWWPFGLFAPAPTSQQLPLNNLVVCVILPLNNVSSFLMLFFIHCSAPASVLLPFIVVCVFKVNFGMPMMMLVFAQT
jgi:hypothetical protein